MYNAELDEWKQMPDFPGMKRGYSYGVAMENSFGSYAYLGFGKGARYLNDFWRYDMRNGKWEELASCPGLGRSHPAMVGLSSVNKVYVGLGNNRNTDNSVNNMKDFWEYDVETNSWKKLPDLPGIARHHPFSFGLDSTVYAGFGHSDPGIERDWYALDSSTSTWKQLAHFTSYNHDNTENTTEGRNAGTEFTIPDCGLGAVLSGDGNNHLSMETGEFHVYNATNDRWTARQPHPGPSRWAPGSFVIGNTVYLTSGQNRIENKVLNDLWALEVQCEF